MVPCSTVLSLFKCDLWSIHYQLHYVLLTDKFRFRFHLNGLDLQHLIFSFPPSKLNSQRLETTENINIIITCTSVVVVDFHCEGWFTWCLLLTVESKLSTWTDWKFEFFSLEILRLVTSGNYTPIDLMPQWCRFLMKVDLSTLYVIMIEVILIRWVSLQWCNFVVKDITSSTQCLMKILSSSCIS